jgi:hypothetical protein
VTRTLTIYGSQAAPMARHEGVTGLRMPQTGHLIVHTERYTMTYAAGHWQAFSDTAVPSVPSLHDATQAPVVPGNPRPPVPTDPGPVDPFLSQRAPYAPDVHDAMQIHCACEQIRCPVVLNEATDGQRRWWQVRGFNAPGASAPAVAEPLRRCVHELGHDTAELAHTWHQGGWPYGIAQHHPACPRNPNVYNRAPLMVEGQQATQPAGVTTGADVPDRADVSSTVVLTGDEPEQPAATTIIRPYVTEATHPAHAATPDDDPTGFFYDRNEGNSGPGGLLPTTAQLDAGEYNRAARTSWGVCAAYAPESVSPQRVWCAYPPGHDGAHATNAPGGDRLHW